MIYAAYAAMYTYTEDGWYTYVRLYVLCIDAACWSLLYTYTQHATKHPTSQAVRRAPIANCGRALRVYYILQPACTMRANVGTSHAVYIHVSESQHPLFEKGPALNPRRDHMESRCRSIERHVVTCSSHSDKREIRNMRAISREHSILCARPCHVFTRCDGP